MAGHVVADGVDCGLPDSAHRLEWSVPRHRAALANCAVFDHRYGFDYDVALLMSEVKTRYRNSGGQFLVLPSARKIPPAAVSRFEWQHRALISPEDLDDGYDPTNVDNSARGYRGEAKMVRLREEYLRAFFVRRQRFEKLSTKITRRDFSHNLSARQLPGRFTVWYLRSYADERMVSAIVRADSEELWPHHRFTDYMVAAVVSFEEELLQRDFRFREHTRDLL